MNLAKAHIIRQLQREILPLEGVKTLPSDVRIDLGLPSLETAFPKKRFPVGCMHEFITDSLENAGAGYGFITFLLSQFMKQDGPALWVAKRQSIFPGALTSYGINPHHIVFVNLQKEKDVLFTLEEALKCDHFTAVIGEVSDIDFKQSRRLQLAAEKSRVTGFIFRNVQKSINTIAAVSRWQITSLQSHMKDDIPGVGYPRWLIELQKIRNGSPGKWMVELRADGLHDISGNVYEIPRQYSSKTG